MRGLNVAPAEAATTILYSGQMLDPTTGLYDGRFRAHIDATSLGYPREIDLVIGSFWVITHDQHQVATPAASRPSPSVRGRRPTARRTFSTVHDSDSPAGPVAATVTLGVAPLLFVQELFGRVFFTSSILMAWFWLAIIALLIPAYYGVYLYAFGLRNGGVAMKPVHRAAGSAGEINLGVTSVAAPKAASSSTAR